MPQSARALDRLRARPNELFERCLAELGVHQGAFFATKRKRRQSASDSLCRFHARLACATIEPMNMGTLLATCAVAALLTVACDDGASTACSPDQLTDPSFVESATRSPDGKGWCCKPGFPTCDCGYFGGFVQDRCQCGERFPRGSDPSPFGYCDLAPPDWILETDAHGCSAYHARAPTTACCNCPSPDASSGDR
jgi:hypothetical protein